MIIKQRYVPIKSGKQLKNKHMVTDREYYQITNCSGTFMFPNFTVNEAQIFLISLGYKIIVHKAPCKVREVNMDGGEVRPTGRTFEEARERILAVKEGDKLPNRIDSDEAEEMDLHQVFNKELKKKVLGI